MNNANKNSMVSREMVTPHTSSEVEEDFIKDVEAGIIEANA